MLSANDPSEGRNRPADAPATSGVADATCEATPRQTEGPYYFDAGKVRRDITEGKPGIPLSVRLRLVETGSCEPIPGAAVDIWHTDAEGRYSGYRRQGDDGADTTGETFLRGTQFTDADGLVEFETLYPGWYRNRTVHIHFKAYTDDEHLLTSQLYFPGVITAAVSAIPPYSLRNSPGNNNESDDILMTSPANEALLGQVARDGDGYVVWLTVGIAR